MFRRHVGTESRMNRQRSRHVRRLVKLLRLLASPMFRRGLRFGVGAAIEHRGAIGPMALETVVDVGAHTGQFSLLVRALHPSVRIVAFEPQAGAAARYRRVFAQDSRTTLHQAAIAPQRGPAAMHVSASSDSSSLLPITRRQAELFPGTGEVGTIAVDAGPLDAFIAPEDLAAPALLKIDVQGFEMEVLRGSRPLLGFFEHVYVEASFEELYEGQALAGEVAAFLEERGFAEAGRFNVSADRAGAPIQADFLFHRVNRTPKGKRPDSEARPTGNRSQERTVFRTASKRAAMGSMGNAASA